MFHVPAHKNINNPPAQIVNFEKPLEEHILDFKEDTKIEVQFNIETKQPLDVYGLLGKLVDHSCLKVRATDVIYPGPDGTIQSALTVVAKAKVVNKINAIGIAYLIAADLGEDCIAVFFPHLNEGVLVGPNASRWGAFDNSKFVSYK